MGQVKALHLELSVLSLLLILVMLKSAGRNVLIEEKETRRRLGYVAQDVAIDKILTGRELLQLQGDLYHLIKI